MTHTEKPCTGKGVAIIAAFWVVVVTAGVIFGSFL